ESTIKKYAEFIKDEKTKLNNQVERILEVAALRKDAIDIPIEPINLSKIIIQVLADFELHFKQKNVEVNTNISGVDTILGNEFHLSNVLRNILENAIKYSKENPIIEINTQLENQILVLEIIDNGI